MSEFRTTRLNDHLNSSHLDDEQFSALLAGEALTVETQAHLNACAECRLEIERVTESMESFSSLSLDWAERRSATMAPVRVPARTAWRRPAAWASATAVLALGVLLGVRHDQGNTTGDVAHVAAPHVAAPQDAAFHANAEVQNAPAMAPAQPSRHLTREQQIAEDNRMLLAIRHELTRPDAFRLPASGPRGARTAHTGNDVVDN